MFCTCDTPSVPGTNYSLFECRCFGLLNDKAGMDQVTPDFGVWRQGPTYVVDATYDLVITYL